MIYFQYSVRWGGDISANKLIWQQNYVSNHDNNSANVCERNKASISLLPFCMGIDFYFLYIFKLFKCIFFKKIKKIFFKFNLFLISILYFLISWGGTEHYPRFGDVSHYIRPITSKYDNDEKFPVSFT